jgi:hypothetical protein
MMNAISRIIAALFLVVAAAADVAAEPQKLITFNDNGAWCWYQDPRVVHDPANNTLLVASVAAAEGPGGAERAGDIDVVTYRLDDGATRRFVLHRALLEQDDHNTPALLIRPDGRYVAMYSRHNQDAFTYWRVSARPHDATAWEPEQTFDWTPHFKDPRNHVTYANLFYLSAEKRTYDFSRAVNTDPTILVSADQGSTWSFGGKLLTGTRLGYVNGYAKYASNGVDRVDFVMTEHHPRDFNNSIYHGFVKAGKLHRTDGTVVDHDVFDAEGRPATELTKVFPAGSVFGGETMSRAWTVCLRLDPAGHPFGLVTCRANDPDNKNFSDHRLFSIRQSGDGGADAKWTVRQVAKLGGALWPAEQDYTGLGDVDPSDPNVVYVSTPIDPRDGKALKVHEIFKGITADGGDTWSWTAVTSDSPVDNLRPVVCPLAQGGRAVLWFRGTMTRSQHYNCAIVGIVEPVQKR